MSSQKDYISMKVADLRELATHRGISATAKKTKADLISALEKEDSHVGNFKDSMSPRRKTSSGQKKSSNHVEIPDIQTPPQGRKPSWDGDIYDKLTSQDLSTELKNRHISTTGATTRKEKIKRIKKNNNDPCFKRTDSLEICDEDYGQVTPKRSASKTPSPPRRSLSKKTPSPTKKTPSPTKKTPSPTKKTPTPARKKTPSPTKKTPTPARKKTPSPTKKTPTTTSRKSSKPSSRSFRVEEVEISTNKGSSRKTILNNKSTGKHGSNLLSRKIEDVEEDYLENQEDPEDRNYLEDEDIFVTADPEDSEDRNYLEDEDIFVTADPEDSEDEDIFVTADPEDSEDQDVFVTADPEDSEDQDIFVTADPEDSEDQDIFVTADPEDSQSFDDFRNEETSADSDFTFSDVLDTNRSCLNGEIPACQSNYFTNFQGSTLQEALINFSVNNRALVETYDDNVHEEISENNGDLVIYESKPYILGFIDSNQIENLLGKIQGAIDSNIPVLYTFFSHTDRKLLTNAVNSNLDSRNVSRYAIVRPVGSPRADWKYDNDNLKMVGNDSKMYRHYDEYVGDNDSLRRIIYQTAFFLISVSDYDTVSLLQLVQSLQ